MNTVHIVDQKINIKNVYLNQVDTTRSLDGELELKTEDKWKQILKKAEENNSKIWDSKIYRLENISFANGSLNLFCSTINFSTRLSMNAFTEDLKKLGEKFFPFGMFFLVL